MSNKRKPVIIKMPLGEGKYNRALFAERHCHPN